MKWRLESFTEWQINRLRKRLFDYKMANRRNTQPKPWKTVLNDILDCEVTLNEHGEDGKLSNFRVETLRRFAEGKSILQADKLQDVKNFLIYKKMLTEEELNQETIGMDSIIAVRDILSVDTPEAIDHMSKLGDCYEAHLCLPGLSIFCDISLKVSLDSSGHFFRVHEETTHRYAGEDNKFVRKKEGDRTLCHSRDGFGFVSSSQRKLHIFFRSNSPEDNTIYYEADSLDRAGIIRRIYFISVGMDGEWEDMTSEERPHNSHCFSYMTDSLEVVSNEHS